MNQYERAYDRLYRVIPNLDALIANPEVSAFKLKAGAYMDLCVDILERQPGKTKISLAHYYKSNGDLVADPDMEIEINHTYKTVEALSITQMGRYQPVYNEDHTKVYPQRKKEQNSFLSNTWLMNLIHQGHKLDESTVE